MRWSMSSYWYLVSPKVAAVYARMIPKQALIVLNSGYY